MMPGRAFFSDSVIDTFSLSGEPLEGIWSIEYRNPEYDGPETLKGYYIGLGGRVFETRVLNCPEGQALVCARRLPADAMVVEIPDMLQGKPLLAVRLAYPDEVEELAIVLDFGQEVCLQFYPLSAVYPAAEMSLGAYSGEEVLALALGGRFPESVELPAETKKSYCRNTRLQQAGIALVVGSFVSGIFMGRLWALLVLGMGIAAYFIGTLLNLRKIVCPWCGMREMRTQGHAGSGMFCDNCQNTSRLDD
jgi:hypothetical protein